MKTGDFDPSLPHQFKDAGHSVSRMLGVLVLIAAVAVIAYFGLSHG